MDQGELTALLAEHATLCSVPGAAVGVVRDGAAVSACHGVTDVRTDEPVVAATRFGLGSLTKPMVATVIVRLAETGRVSLDDAVAAHVPELRGSSWAEHATLRDLLANRSGLPLRAELEFGFDDRADADEAALSRLVAEAAGAAPRADFWSYTNVGWCILGRAIETATGLAWDEAMRRELLEPAGMTRTVFTCAPDVAERVSGHQATADGAVPVAPLGARAYGPAGTTGISTVGDLLRFASLHLQETSLAELRVVHADVSIHGWLDAWCLGWASFDWGGHRVWGWDGLIDGERSVLRLLPEQRAAVVLLANGSTGRALYRSLFADLVPMLFGSGFPRLRVEPDAPSVDDLERFAGVYAWPDRRMEVTASATGLRLEGRGGATEAYPIDERTFVIDALDPDNPTVTFAEFDEAARPRVLYLMLWGLPRHDG